MMSYRCVLWVAAFLAGAAAFAQQNPAGLQKPGTTVVKDAFVPLAPGEVRLNGGFLGDRFSASERNRLLHVNEDDLLDAFERRDAPHQDWQGEHVGKFLHAATLVWATTRDKELKAKIDRVAGRLIKTQEADGYLGTYPPAQRWTRWDVWVHKYDLIGLLTYYQYTHSAPALQACRRVGDLLVSTFGPGGRDVNKAGEHVGMAATSVIEPVMLLYRATGDDRYKAFAERIVKGYDAPDGPAILASLEKYRAVNKVANGKAYEMLSNLNGLLELYRSTGDKRFLDDARIAWKDIVNKRLYITGSASSFEHFQDDDVLPNGEAGNLCETCVTVTWEQMNLQLLRLTGEERFADQLERTIYNHLLAAQKPTGDQWSYYTPLEGRKPYSAATSCCLSSGPRGVALIPSVAAMRSADGGLVVNLYNSGTLETELPAGTVKLTTMTDYPFSGAIQMIVSPYGPVRFPLRLRIPGWAKSATVTVNGKTLTADRCEPGTYAVLDRTWRSGDTVTLDVPMPAVLVRGDHGNDGKAAITRGPLVLAIDTALNPDVRMLKQAALAADDVAGLKIETAQDHSLGGLPAYRAEGEVAGKPQDIYLTPYATAGQDGESRFAVWIARPGREEMSSGTGSLLYGGRVTFSRLGNQTGDIADDDFSTFRVTWDGTNAAEDWYAVSVPKSVTIDRVVYAHGKIYHDGGWFDASAGKPRIEVQQESGGPWKPVGTLETYPATSATDAAGIKDGQAFEVRFPPVVAVAVRVIGKPACGDNPAQAFSSCAELRAFGPAAPSR